MNKIATLGLALAVPLGLFSLPCHAGQASQAGKANTEEPAPTPVAVRRALEPLLPTGVILKDVTMTGQHASINAAAQNTQQVSQFLRRIASFAEFRSVNLASMDQTSQGDSKFTVSMDVQCPKPGEHVANNPCDASVPAKPSVYKCTVNGATTYQSTPCAAGSKR